MEASVPPVPPPPNPAPVPPIATPEDAQPTAAQIPPPNSEQMDQTQVSRSQKKRMLWTTGTIVIILALVIGAIFYSKNNRQLAGDKESDFYGQTYGVFLKTRDGITAMEVLSLKENHECSYFMSFNVYGVVSHQAERCTWTFGDSSILVHLEYKDMPSGKNEDTKDYRVASWDTLLELGGTIPVNRVDSDKGVAIINDENKQVDTIPGDKFIEKAKALGMKK